MDQSDTLVWRLLDFAQFISSIIYILIKLFEKIN